MNFDDGTWWLYTMGVLMLFFSAAFAFSIYRSRQSMSEFLARRAGHAAGGSAGIGLTLIAVRAAGNRLSEASILLQGATICVCGLAVLVLASLGAQRAASLILEQPQDVRAAPRMELQPGQRTAWSSAITSKMFLAPGIIFLCLGPCLVFVPSVPLWAMPLLVAAGAGMLAFSSVRVSADAEGLRVRYGMFPWPATHISLDQIDEASVIEVNPLDWGGWGYRGTLKLMGQAAVVLRKGPGIRLDLRNDKVFVVTVDDPETPVALINGELTRSAVT